MAKRWGTSVGRNWPYLLVALAIAALLGYFLVYSYYAVRLFQFPFDYDQGEGYELLDTILFSEGVWPYQDSNTYPFYSSNYPPVFHLAIVPLVWIFGPHYWTGRLMSYAGTLVTAFLIGYAVQRQGKRWWLSIIAGLLFLASNYIYHVGPLFRQHLFMVMLETLAIVLVTVVIDREERTGRRNNWGLLAVMLALLLAGYTKQLAYATVAAVFLFLFLRQPKRAITWAIPFAAITGLIFVLIDVATDGQWYLNSIAANLNSFIPEQAIGLYRQWFALHLVVTAVAGIYALYQLYFDRLSAYVIWFGVAAVNSVTAGTWGAGESYFATAIAASCILTGLAFARLLNWGRDRGKPGPFSVEAWLLTAVALLVLFQASRFVHLPTHSAWLRQLATSLGQPPYVMLPPQTSCSAPRDPQVVEYVDSAGISLLGRPPSATDSAAGRRIVDLLLQGETPAFSEEAGFNLYAGRPVITNPTQLRNLDLAGALDVTEMVDMLDRQAFDTVIFRAQFYPPAVLDIIGQRYETGELVEMNGFVYCIMYPRVDAEEVSP